MVVDIANVGGIGRAAFGKDKRYAKPDALSSIRLQPPPSCRLLIGFCKPLFSFLLSRCQCTKLGFGICSYRQFSDCNIEPEYFSRLVTEEQVSKGVSGYQRHALGTQPTPVGKKSFNI